MTGTPLSKLLLVNLSFFMCRIYWSRTEQPSGFSLRQILPDLSKIVDLRLTDYWSMDDQIFSVFMKQRISEIFSGLLKVFLRSFQNGVVFSWEIDWHCLLRIDWHLFRTYLPVPPFLLSCSKQNVGVQHRRAIVETWCCVGFR